MSRWTKEQRQAINASGRSVIVSAAAKPPYLLRDL